MTTYIHRASLNGKPVCLASGGRISVSGCVVTCPDCQRKDAPQQEQGGNVYAVKCDQCKQVISFTYNIQESYEGGLCQSCNL